MHLRSAHLAPRHDVHQALTLAFIQPQNLIIDGSPQWEVYRTVPVGSGGAAGTSASQSEPSSTGRTNAAASAEYSAATAGGLILNTKTFTFEVCSPVWALP